MQGFKDFLLRGNLIELAVAFIIGAVFADVVSSFTNIVLSLIGFFGGVPNFNAWAPGGLPVGTFLTSLLTFILTAAIVYFFVVLPYNKFRDRKKVEEPEKAATSEELLTDIRDLLASR
ncbi:MscL family protein [Microlunatus sp. Y2014]|uniref:large conductance mechanosensitive channel protein MscL n=1 Tax=Microlunatus sp. Y2014 TaxID=3418488 RepID=UPI003DA74FBE